MSQQGNPCWYELSTEDPSGAKAFYAAILGWTWAEAPMPGMTYNLASAGPEMVAGMMASEGGQPQAWTIYFAVDDCDGTVEAAAAAGARIIVPPTDIPGTGRFAILCDPQGAGFAVLQPLPDGAGGAFDQQKPGHGNWHELMTGDDKAALAFYGRLFGWTVTRSMEMGPGMNYSIIAHGKTDIGGVFPSPASPSWRPYFGVISIAAAQKAVPAAGGKVTRGPDEVPGGAFILHCEDPSGVFFALVGPT